MDYYPNLSVCIWDYPRQENPEYPLTPAQFALIWYFREAKNSTPQGSWSEFKRKTGFSREDVDGKPKKRKRRRTTRPL